jgi:cellulose synthase/poly-beta-1,6-N-acetylglucosamine synthase-like glycosyltransferase
LDDETLGVSVILEWDNVGRGGGRRATRVLRALDRELSTIDRPAELIVVHDPGIARSTDVEQLARAAVSESVPIRFLAEPGSTYYAQKNLGAAASSGDIVVFIDSDTAPEPSWLHELLSPFEDPDVSVVAGATYTEFESFPDRALALTWNFPIRSDGGANYAFGHFNANSVAFRRPVFEKHNFPSDLRFRGQCHSLAEELLSNDIEILVNPRARVAHPPPRGLWYITQRAMCQGHDRLLTYRAAGGTDAVFRSVKVLGADIKVSWRRTRRSYRSVGVTVGQIPAVMGIAIWYHLWSCIGWLAAMLVPGTIRRYLRV